MSFLLNLSEYENNPAYKQGSPCPGIPDSLHSLLPPIRLLQPKQKPGVFGLYFSLVQKIYIGQSRNVSFEISMYRTGQRTQIELNRLLQEHGENLFAFAFFQGDALKDEKTRRDIEAWLINQTLSATVNSVMTVNHGLAPHSDFANTSFLTAQIMTGSLKQYGLEYTGIDFPKEGGCIYLYLNPQTKRFYIGETTNFKRAGVLKRHRRDLFAFQKRQQQGIKKTGDYVLERVFSDFKPDRNKLLYTCLEHLGHLKKKERVEVETRYKKKAFRVYGNRLYNKQNFVPRPGSFSHNEGSKNLIRQASLFQNITMDTTQYPCIVRGQWYKNRSVASLACGYTSRDGLKYKFSNPSETDFICLKDTKGKPIPEQFKRKVEEFFKNLQPKEKRIIKRDFTE